MNASFFKKHRLDYISPPPVLKGHSKDFALTSEEWNFVTFFSFVGCCNQAKIGNAGILLCQLPDHPTIAQPR